jgi:beta-phosphoglucomutase-like phosphatase (HAD superfamily)
MKLKLVLFGSIGSFSETSILQLEAFNEAFKINGITLNWKKKEYVEYLKIQGGKNRLRKVLPNGSDDKLIGKIHNDKTRLFQQKLLEGKSNIRPHFENLCSELLDNNIDIGLASTTFLNSIQAILSQLKTIQIKDFSFIGHQSLVIQKKPNPEIYELALKKTGMKSDETIAFEDTHLSLKSSVNAGIKCIAIPGDLSREQDFSESVKIVSNYYDLDLKQIESYL